LVRDTHPTTSPLIRRSLCAAMGHVEFRVYAGPNSPNSLSVPMATGKEPAPPEDSHTRLKAVLQTVSSISCTPNQDGHSATTVPAA
jgi:hypothetical protein